MIVVYSALFGAYDSPPEAPFSDSCRHVLFTDQRVDAPGWDVQVVEPMGHPRLQSRSFKLRPHVHFHGANTLYHDANMTLIVNPIVVHATLLGDAPLGMLRHHRRRNLAQEFTAVARGALADPSRLEDQKRRYRHLLSVPIGQAGLLAVTPAGEPFMTAWWAEVAAYTHRDQLALPAAAEASGIHPNLLAVDLEEFVTRTDHLKPRRHT